MRNIINSILILIVAILLAACGDDVSKEARYPHLQIHLAEQELTSYMKLQGYERKFPVQDIVETSTTEDGRPAFIFNMSSVDGRETAKFIVSINKSNFDDYTSSILTEDY